MNEEFSPCRPFWTVFWKCEGCWRPYYLSGGESRIPERPEALRVLSEVRKLGLSAGYAAEDFVLVRSAPDGEGESR